VRPADDGIVLSFKDLMMDHKFALRGATEYTYQITGPRFKTEKKSTRQPEIGIDRATLAAAIERGGANAPVEVTIWVTRQGLAPDPVKVYFDWSPNRTELTIRHIERG